MANSALIEVVVTGAEAYVDALLKDEALSAARDIERSNAAPNGHEENTASFRLESRWADAFKEIEAVAARHSNVVVAAAAVELGNVNATGRVYRGSDMIGTYDMPEDEIRDLAGDEYEEAPVLDSLFATIASWQDDALRALRSTPAP